MIGRTVSHYRIVEKLGEGGMGIVYKAEDFKLDRFVALKFLPRQLDADNEAKKRFVLEAKSASSLEHSNICTIHEIDETPDGAMFIVMPCYEGRTLTQKMQEGPMELEAVIDLALQAASGLAIAHEKNIIHRDIKPGNILLTDDGQVKIVDFGLAKLTGHTKITKTGKTLGTVSYMSPQQAMGEEVGPDSDVFSLGVVLYELIAGENPFKADHEAAILYRIVHEKELPLSEHRSDIPDELERIVEKALQKKASDRYQNAAELRDDLKMLSRMLTASETAPLPKTTRFRRLRRRVRGRRIAALAAVGLVVAVSASLLVWQSRVQSPSAGMYLAVMDFRDLTTSKDPTVSAGMTGLVRVGLVESSPIRVLSPEYLYDLRRRLFETVRGPIEEAEALEVARQAGATLLLSGQMGAAGAASYVTWRLVEVTSGKSLAARRVEGDNQVLLADQIIAEVLPILAQQSGVEVPVSPPSVSNLTTTSHEAYRHYVAGILAREENRGAAADEELEQAVRLDTTFALAFFELSRNKDLDFERESARALSEHAWQYRARLGIKDRMRLEAWREWVDDNDADAVTTYKEMLARWPDDRNVLSDLSELLFYNWHFDEAVAISGQGLDLYPDDLLFGSFYGTCLAYTGRANEALNASRAYVERHPENPNAWDDLGLRYLGVGLPDSAEIAFRKAWEMDEYFWRGVGYCDYCRGNVDGAIETFEQALAQGDLSSNDSISVMTDVSFWPGLALFYAEQGRFTKALALFDDARQDISGPETTREIEGRIKILLRAGRAEEALSLTDTLYERAAVGYERLSAIRYRARSLVALDSLEAARLAAIELREEEKASGRSEPFLLLRVSADIALAEGDHESALSAVREMQHHGVPLGGLYDIGRRETLAQALRMARRPREAADVLEELVRIYGSHAVAHYELGRIYEEMGRAAAAEREYEDFLTSWSRADNRLVQVTDAQARLTAIRETRRTH